MRGGESRLNTELSAPPSSQPTPLKGEGVKAVMRVIALVIADVFLKHKKAARRRLDERMEYYGTMLGSASLMTTAVGVVSACVAPTATSFPSEEKKVASWDAISVKTTMLSI